jgi:hypothetical protein
MDVCAAPTAAGDNGLRRKAQPMSSEGHRLARARRPREKNGAVRRQYGGTAAATPNGNPGNFTRASATEIEQLEGRRCWRPPEPQVRRRLAPSQELSLTTARDCWKCPDPVWMNRSHRGGDEGHEG